MNPKFLMNLNDPHTIDEVDGNLDALASGKALAEQGFTAVSLQALWQLWKAR